MLETFFKAIEENNLSEYTSLLFNFYEDENNYTIEACFDEDSLIIGRDAAFVIGSAEVSWKIIEKDTGKILKEHIKKQDAYYKHFTSIAYGFVDGDLYYIKRPRKKRESIHFSPDDFIGFAPMKLEVWLTVYLTKEAKEKYQTDLWNTDFSNLSKEDEQYWREVLADNFDYKKYYR